MQTIIAVGAITRGRPEMFARLCKSFAQMTWPDDVKVLFIFAENADALSVEASVEDLRAQTGCDCALLLEPRLGIPIARNCVLDRALALGADFLTFVDDDEWVAPNWLDALWHGMQRSGAQLATGPVRPVHEGDAPLSALESRLLDGIVAWSERTNVKNRCNVGRDEGFRIGAATNNWICDLAFLRKVGLRFDESIGLGGGSDTAFWRELMALGGKNTWIDDAQVFEDVPKSRLSIAYQFRRGRDQAIAEWNRRGEGGGLYVAIRSLPLMIRCGAVGVAQICLGLLIPGPHLVFGLRDLGKAVGRARAINGEVSTHYSRVHGG